MSIVTYTVTLSANNVELVKKINALLIADIDGGVAVTGNGATVAQKTTADQNTTKPKRGRGRPPKTASMFEAEDAEDAEDINEAEDVPKTTMSELKAIAKTAKAEHSEPFLLAVLKDFEITPATTIGRSLAKIPAELYDDIIAAWEEGPQDDDGDDEDEDDDDLEEDDDLEDEEHEAPTIDSVKKALKAYANDVGRDEARALLKKHKIGSMSNVPKASEKQLAGIFKDLLA